MSEVSNLRQRASNLRVMADFLDQQAAQIDAKFAELGLDAAAGTPVAKTGVKPKAGKSTTAKGAKAAQGTRRGRPPGSRNKPKTAAETGRANTQSLRSLIVDILKNNKDGLDLATITKKCVDAGYQSSTKGKFANMVYQNLYKLMNSEKAVAKNDKIYTLVAAPAA